MADQHPPQAAAFATEPVKDTAAMGIPVEGPGTARSPAPASTTHPHRQPRIILFSVAIALAFIGLICQAVFMNHKLTINAYFDDPDLYPTTYTDADADYDPSSDLFDSPAPSSSTAGRKLLAGAGHDAAIAFATVATGPHASLTATVGRHLTRSKSKGKRKGSYGYDGYRLGVIKGKDVAKAPGMVIAAAVIALVAAIALLVVMLVIPILAQSLWGVVAEVAAVALVLVLWLAAMGCSAKTASILREPVWKEFAPKVWVAGNAIALTCAILSLFVWGAILALGVLALMAELRMRQPRAAPAAAVTVAQVPEVSPKPLPAAEAPDAVARV